MPKQTVEKKLEDEFKKCSPNAQATGELCFELYKEQYNKYMSPMLTKWDDLTYKEKLIWVGLGERYEPHWAIKQSTKTGG